MFAAADARAEIYRPLWQQRSQPKVTSITAYKDIRELNFGYENSSTVPPASLVDG